MIRIQRLLGVPVLRESGKRVGKVKDIWFDEFWSVVGIVLDCRIWFRKARKVVLMDQIFAFGQDALIIRNESQLDTFELKQLLRTYYTGVIRIKDMPVFTKEGLHLGEVSDVYFKENEGTPIIGFELSDGFLSDVLEGRRRLFMPERAEDIRLGENAILVPASYERILK
ncbi:MAG: PRC-barrel domain-containing protein [Candidatus Cohnella colombiensis]|uniref:PRC-barrel domain-containing protein n=1 Tax=Candidatus Cohnella colombiensis TaxID=3121368 RepID=A0AA95EUH0_9BACL|nr:MAG: PRC-barrel domain-containing protein [Cohnella sp.]